MRTLVTYLAMLLLLLFAVGEQPVAKDTPEGWSDPSGAHPWGGDESPDVPGDNTDGDSPTVDGRRANTISFTGYLYLDYLFHYFVYQPRYEAAQPEADASRPAKYHRQNRQR